MAANDSTPPPPPPPPPGTERPQTAVPPVEAQPAAPVAAPPESQPGPPIPLAGPGSDSGAPRPDPYAPPTPGYSPAGYGYQAPANPPTSPYLQPGEAGYGAQPVAGQPVYAQPAYGQPQYGYPPVAPKGLAITSMVLGIVGIISFGFFTIASIAAIITGHIAQRKQPYAKSFWITGLITGYIGLAFFVIFIVFTTVLAVVYPSA